jgi:hypothetical protein
MTTFFISYGDSNFANSRRRILLEANNSGMFDYVRVYQPTDLSEEFKQYTQPYISQSHGGGYWLWKPYILKKAFDDMKVGDVCVYADAGCHVNAHGKDRLQQYIDMVTADTSGIISFDLESLTEEMYNTERVFEYFNIPENDTAIRKTNQLMATILILRKCEASIKLVNEYYQIAITQPSLFSDEHNEYKKQEVYRGHRHDQSILSILRKKHGSLIIPDETYSATDYKQFKHIPILSTRIKN